MRSDRDIQRPPKRPLASRNKPDAAADTASGPAQATSSSASSAPKPAGPTPEGATEVAPKPVRVEYRTPTGRANTPSAPSAPFDPRANSADAGRRDGPGFDRAPSRAPDRNWPAAERPRNTAGPAPRPGRPAPEREHAHKPSSDFKRPPSAQRGGPLQSERYERDERAPDRAATRPAQPRYEFNADPRSAPHATFRADSRRDTRAAPGRDAGSAAPAPVRTSGSANQANPANPADGVRLSKILSDRGLASRREADDWIDAGWVKVNGEMAVLGQRVQPQDRIEVDPAAQTQQAKRVTILINKPIGYVSGQAEDGYEPASVLVTLANHWEEDPARKPFHPGHARGLAPAGRLDIDSTGLLVLTQDGRIAKHLIGEDSLVEKEYLVRVEYQNPGPLLDENAPQAATLRQPPPGGQENLGAALRFPESELKRLNHGLELDGHQLKPAKVSWANEDQLRFVLREGRKRQIRRMCELVGLKVLALKRVRIGSVVLGKLPAGQWRYLREDERF